MTVVLHRKPPHFLKKWLDILPGSGRGGETSFSPNKKHTLFRNPRRSMWLRAHNSNNIS